MIHEFQNFRILTQDGLTCVSKGMVSLELH